MPASPSTVILISFLFPGDKKFCEKAFAVDSCYSKGNKTVRASCMHTEGACVMRELFSQTDESCSIPDVRGQLQEPDQDHLGVIVIIFHDHYFLYQKAHMKTHVMCLFARDRPQPTASPPLYRWWWLQQRPMQTVWLWPFDIRRGHTHTHTH